MMRVVPPLPLPWIRPAPQEEPVLSGRTFLRNAPEFRNMADRSIEPRISLHMFRKQICQTHEG
jgi:hypothetical protein